MSSTPRPWVISPLFEILRPIVDQMVDAKRTQFLVLGGGRRPYDLGAEVLSNLGGGHAHAAACRMDQHRLAGLERAHDDNQLPSGEIVDRNRRAFLGGHAFGSREDPTRRRAYDIGIAAKPGHQREHVASDPARIDAFAHGVDAAGDLVSRNDGNLGQIRIEAHPAHHVSEIDPACLNANARLARPSFGIRGLFEDERLWRPSFRNPNLAHC